MKKNIIIIILVLLLVITWYYIYSIPNNNLNEKIKVNVNPVSKSEINNDIKKIDTLSWKVDIDSINTNKKIEEVNLKIDKKVLADENNVIPIIIEPLDKFNSSTTKFQIKWNLKEWIDKVIVKFSNKTSAFAVNTHLLNKFTKWDKQFIYNVDKNFQNLDFWINEYIIEAYEWNIKHTLKIKAIIPKSENNVKNLWKGLYLDQTNKFSSELYYIEKDKYLDFMNYNINVNVLQSWESIWNQYSFIWDQLCSVLTDKIRNLWYSDNDYSWGDSKADIWESLWKSDQSVCLKENLVNSFYIKVSDNWEILNFSGTWFDTLYDIKTKNIHTNNYLTADKILVKGNFIYVSGGWYECSWWLMSINRDTMEMKDIIVTECWTEYENVIDFELTNDDRIKVKYLWGNQLEKNQYFPIMK